jgi:hypothetical protein
MRFASALVPVLMLVLEPALAGGPVFKQVDEWGATIYSDRPALASSKAIRNRIPPAPGAAGYDAAVNRAESDRLYLQRNYAENLQPRKVAIYDPAPGYAQHRNVPARIGTPYPIRSRWDASLPPSPAPSLERNYYYNGR